MNIPEPRTTTEIPPTGECPFCSSKHNDWIMYIRPEEVEVGVICPVCHTHFKDEAQSLEYWHRFGEDYMGV